MKKFGEAVSLKNYGTMTTDTDTDAVVCRGWTTISAHLDSGTGVLTWNFKGPDNVWRGILVGSDFITALAFTDVSHMANVFFAVDVEVKATGSSGSSPVWDWQISSERENKG